MNVGGIRDNAPENVPMAHDDAQGTAKEKVRRIQAIVGTPYDMGFACRYALQNDLTGKEKYDRLHDMLFGAALSVNNLPYDLGHADDDELRLIAGSVSNAKNRSIHPGNRYLDEWERYSPDELKSGIIHDLLAQLSNVRRICEKLENSQAWNKLDKYGLADDLSGHDRDEILSALKDAEAIGQIAKEGKRIEKTWGEYRRAIAGAASTLEDVSDEDRRSLVDGLLQYAGALEKMDYSLAFEHILEKNSIYLCLASEGRLEKIKGKIEKSSSLVQSALRKICIEEKDIPKDPLIVRYTGDDMDDFVCVQSMDIYGWFLEGLENMDVIIGEKDGRIRLIPKDADSWIDNYSKMHVYASVLNGLKNSGVWIGGTKENPVLFFYPDKHPAVSEGRGSGHMIERAVMGEIIRVLPPERRRMSGELIAAPKKSIAQIYGELRAIKEDIMGRMPAGPGKVCPVLKD